jgi:integrase
MPARVSTKRSCDAWIDNHILPRWGDCTLSKVQARPVELWLQSLALAPKSKLHIRGLLSVLWDYAMWCGDVPTQRNPMELVSIKAGSQRIRKPNSLTAEQFQFVAGTNSGWTCVSERCCLRSHSIFRQ